MILGCGNSGKTALIKQFERNYSFQNKSNKKDISFDGTNNKDKKQTKNNNKAQALKNTFKIFYQYSKKM